MEIAIEGFCPFYPIVVGSFNSPGSTSGDMYAC